MSQSDDKLAIMQVIIQADQLAGQKDAARYVALFAEDGAIAGTQGMATGHAELTQMVTNVWQKEGHTLHLTNAIMIADLTAATATATSVLMIVDVDTLKIVSVAQITHTLALINGQWLFTERRIA